LGGGFEGQDLRGAAAAPPPMRDEAELVRCREMMKLSTVHSSSESENERLPELEEEARTELEEKSRTSKKASSSFRCLETGDAMMVEAARRDARSRRICI
jgi:hypothetical protein